MARPGSAQEQTVEEILASIRQAITADQARRPMGVTRPGMPATRERRTGTVTAIHSGQPGNANDAVGAGVPAASTAPGATAADRSEMHEVIELAIEQALDAVDPEELRAETARPQIAPPRRAEPPPPRPQVQREPRATEMARPLAALPRPAPPRGASPPRETERSLLSPKANAAVASSFDDLARVLASRGARDLDRTVEDLLRPMLRGWLDDNLPPLVERLVREEIERVSRGRG